MPEFVKKVALRKEEAARMEGVGSSTQLHLDEIALKKGQGNFETVIYTEDKVLETVPGRKSGDIQGVIKAIAGIERIKQVCMDMCAAFADAVRQVMSQAETVLDRFHIVKLLNEKLDKLRKKTHGKLDEARRKRYATIRFILFKDYTVLHKDEKRLLKEYFGMNQELKAI